MTATPLSDARNLGPQSAETLAAVGITTLGELRDRGTVNTFLALKQAGQPISLNLLWAMEGAVTGRRWRKVAREDRLRLLLELETLERNG